MLDLVINSPGVFNELSSHIVKMSTLDQFIGIPTNNEIYKS